MTTDANNESSAKGSLVEPLLPPDDVEPELVAAELARDVESDPLSAEAEERLLVEATWEQGEVQQASFRDVPFAIVFLAQAATVLVLAIIFIARPTHWKRGIPPSDDNIDDFFPRDNTGGFVAQWVGLLFFSLIVAAATMVYTLCALVLYSNFSGFAVKFSLVFSPLVLLIVGTYRGSGAMILSACFTFCWARCYWRRVPFATANLSTAAKAICTQYGLVLLSITSMLTSLLWIFIWVMGLAEAAALRGDNDQNEDTPPDYALYALFSLSLIWTWQVISNVLHTTVAGVVGEWWFSPEQENRRCGSLCSRQVANSLFRATVYSFGSICFGAFVIGIVQVLQIVIRESRRSGQHRTNVCCCLLQCIANQLEHLVRYVNRWSFVYVGLYGYDYVNAGRRVFDLFQARGWSVIINDHLVSRAMTMVIVAIACLSGITGVVLSNFFPGWLHLLQSPDSPDPKAFLEMSSFWISFGFGCLLSSVVLRVMSSAVDTVVVCFAEAPNELQHNHPGEAQKMVEAWRHAYPSECGF